MFSDDKTNFEIGKSFEEEKVKKAPTAAQFKIELTHDDKMALLAVTKYDSLVLKICDKVKEFLDTTSK
jgi:beta-mannanase